MSAASIAAHVDIHAVEEHLSRYAVSCPLCRAVDRMAVAHETCDLESLPVVLIMCRRCGYVMPLSAERLGAAA